MALELYFGLRLAASVSDLKAVDDKGCLFLPPYQFNKSNYLYLQICFQMLLNHHCPSVIYAAQVPHTCEHQAVTRSAVFSGSPASYTFTDIHPAARQPQQPLNSAQSVSTLPCSCSTHSYYPSSQILYCCFLSQSLCAVTTSTFASPFFQSITAELLFPHLEFFSLLLRHS